MNCIRRVRRMCIDRLDGPGRRRLLGLVATCYATSWNKRPVVVRWDENWTHRHGSGTVVSPDVNVRAPEYYDAYTEEVFLWKYKPCSGDTIIDVGAGIGTEALSLARMQPDVQVIAIEAHPAVFKCLDKCCRVNGLSYVIPMNCAVSAEPGTLVISDSEKHLGNTILDSGKVGIEIASRTLDDIVAEHNISRIDFLKMNIEGSESQAVDGMTESIQITGECCIACHDFKAESTGNEFFRSRDKVERFLQENAFQVWTRPDDHRPYVRDMLYARRRS